MKRHFAIFFIGVILVAPIGYLVLIGMNNWDAVKELIQGISWWAPNVTTFFTGMGIAFAIYIVATIRPRKIKDFLAAKIRKVKEFLKSYAVGDDEPYDDEYDVDDDYSIEEPSSTPDTPDEDSSATIDEDTVDPAEMRVSQIIIDEG